MPTTLADWLIYIQQQHPQTIAMGLDRVRAVAAALSLGRPAACVITVGGTNGKGSTVAFITAIARAAGLKVGAYTSPHLLRYNERVQINGQQIDDLSLCDAFARIEQARGDSALTFFEFGTLVALLIFQEQKLDLAVLEVGLGGRLDAVNIIDADVAVITTVDLDHQAYLGSDREAIGGEKAGILRAGKPAVLAERDPPSSLLQHAYRIGAFAIRGYSDYLIERGDTHWWWREPGYQIRLPYPQLPATVQVDNAAAAIAALRASALAISDKAIIEGVASTTLAGRLQKIADSPEVIVDVAHNPQAARELADWLELHRKPTVAVFSALADKDIEAIIAPLHPSIARWYVAPITDAGERGQSAQVLTEKLRNAIPTATIIASESITAALTQARQSIGSDERVLVFGSFHTVAAALAGV